MMTQEKPKKPPHRPLVSTEPLMRGGLGITPELNDWYKQNAHVFGENNGTALRRRVLEAFRNAPDEIKALLLEVKC